MGAEFKAGHGHHAHRFGAAGDGDLDLPGHDGIGGVGDALQAGRAEAVDRLGRDGIGQAGAQADHARHIHALLAFREGAAQDDVIHLGRVERRERAQQVLDHRRGHLIRPHGRQAATLGLADRRASGGHNYWFSVGSVCSHR